MFFNFWLEALEENIIFSLAQWLTWTRTVYSVLCRLLTIDKKTNKTNVVHYCGPQVGVGNVVRTLWNESPFEHFIELYNIKANRKGKNKNILTPLLALQCLSICWTPSSANCVSLRHHKHTGGGGFRPVPPNSVAAVTCFIYCQVKSLWLFTASKAKQKTEQNIWRLCFDIPVWLSIPECSRPDLVNHCGVSSCSGKGAFRERKTNKHCTILNCIYYR